MTATAIDPATCPHPARRLYSWYAFDGVLCVTCCACGSPLRGMVDGPDAWDDEQTAMRQRRRRDTLDAPDDLPF